MPLAFDATANGAATPGTSITYSHTCTGSNLILLVAIVNSGGTGGDVITGITYNSVAMTNAISVDGGNFRVYWWFLVNPATGANDVVVSSSDSEFLRSASASYTGALQTGQPDGTDSDIQTPGTTITSSITTTEDNSWNMSAVANASNLDMTASTGVGAERNNVVNVLHIGDSDAPKTPAGAHGMTWTCSSQNLAAVQISIAPALPSGGNPIFFNGSLAVG